MTLLNNIHVPLAALSIPDVRIPHTLLILMVCMMMYVMLYMLLGKVTYLIVHVTEPTNLSYQAGTTSSARHMMKPDRPISAGEIMVNHVMVQPASS